MIVELHEKYEVMLSLFCGRASLLMALSRFCVLVFGSAEQGL